MKIKELFYDLKSLRYVWWKPLERLYFRIWFAPILLLRRYNYKKCILKVPDVISFDGGVGSKVRPFLGLVVDINESSSQWKWWKYIKRV